MIVYPLDMPGQGFKFSSLGAVEGNDEPIDVRMSLNDNYLASQGINRQFGAVRQPGSRWEGSFLLPPLRQPERARAWLAFLVGLRGQIGTFKLTSDEWDVPTIQPDVDAAAPVDREAVRLAETPAQLEAGGLVPGSFISLNARLRMVINVEDVRNGAVVNFAPEVDDAAVAVLTLSTAPADQFILARLADRRGWSVNQLGHVNMEIGWVEDRG